jgi:hypothetical protein
MFYCNLSFSFQEVKTSAKVVEYLKTYCGIEDSDIIQNVGKTGVVAFIKVIIGSSFFFIIIVVNCITLCRVQKKDLALHFELTWTLSL